MSRVTGIFARTVFCTAWLTAGMMHSGSVVRAEEVQHHGLKADANGTLSYCISCHDGSVAHNVSFCTVQCSAATSHSVLKHYPPLGKESFFASAATVKAKGIKLPNGKVSCISCHNIRVPAKNHLAIDNRGGRLCLTCHIGK